jgi:hypothetical protein
MQAHIQGVDIPLLAPLSVITKIDGRFIKINEGQKTTLKAKKHAAGGK